MRGLLLHF